MRAILAHLAHTLNPPTLSEITMASSIISNFITQNIWNKRKIRDYVRLYSVYFSFLLFKNN